MVAADDVAHFITTVGFNAGDELEAQCFLSYDKGERVLMDYIFAKDRIDGPWVTFSSDCPYWVVVKGQCARLVLLLHAMPRVGVCTCMGAQSCVWVRHGSHKPGSRA